LVLPSSVAHINFQAILFVLSEHLSRTRCPAAATGACLWEKQLATANETAERLYESASRLLTGGIERAQFTPAQHDELRPQPAVMRTDAKAPAKPACHFMGHPLPLNAMRYCPALWQEFGNFQSLSDHSRMVLPSMCDKPQARHSNV
jgi:hypothetical protein